MWVVSENTAGPHLNIPIVHSERKRTAPRSKLTIKLRESVPEPCASLLAEGIASPLLSAGHVWDEREAGDTCPAGRFGRVGFSL